MTLEEVARELYGLPLKEFTKTRNARAKEIRSSGNRDLAKQVARLAKPTTAAWLLNMLVRRHDDEVEQVLSLGVQLREAQANLEGDQLRELDRERRKLTAAVTRQAKALGAGLGQKVSDQVAGEMEETLRAAMADAQGAAALSTGLLTDTFTATGLEPVDVNGVVAVPAAVSSAPTDADGRRRRTSVRNRSEKNRRARRKAEEAFQRAQQALEKMEKVAHAADREAAEARCHREDLEGDRERLRQQLRDLDRAIGGAERDQRAAEKQRVKADRDQESARRAYDRAKARLDRSV